MRTLVVICGLSFAGKSTLARAITERLGFVEVDVDEVGAGLYGLAVGDPAALDGLDFDRIYDAADREIARLLTSGVSVVDASRNFTRAERARARQLAEGANARVVTVFVDTPVGVARQRREDNRTSGSRRDITDDQFEEIVRVFQPPTEEERPLVFNVNDDVESWTALHAGVLRHTDPDDRG
jgi:hypothetical protein